jgi:hypothetical protein
MAVGWTLMLEIEAKDVPAVVSELKKRGGSSRNYNLSYLNPIVKVYVKYKDILECFKCAQAINDALNRKVKNTIFEDKY